MDYILIIKPRETKLKQHKKKEREIFVYCLANICSLMKGDNENQLDE